MKHLATALCIAYAATAFASAGDAHSLDWTAFGRWTVAVVTNRSGFFDARGFLPSVDDDGAGTTNAVISTCGVAYVTGAPAAAELTASVRDLPSWLETRWGGSLSSERAERGLLDSRTLAEGTASGAGSCDIRQALANEIIGGALSLTVQVSNTVEATVPFFIRGKNPLDATVRAYIDANVDEEFRPYAWMIAKHESKSGDRVYNQFNPSGARKELPNKTAGENRWGWGIGQIDGSNMVSSVVWDWHSNIQRVNVILRNKRDRYNEVVGWFRARYQDDPTTVWVDPDNVTTNVEGITLTARQWAIITLYNGAGGCDPLPFEGHENESFPLSFDPAETNWVFSTNMHNYCPAVMADSLSQEVE